MKYKLKTKRNVGVVSFAVEGDKGDQLDYVDAKRLERGDLVSFVPLSYEARGRSYRIDYRVAGLACVSDVLKSPLPPSLLWLMLQSFLRMMRDCEENGLMRQRVVVELDKVFYAPSSRSLRFAYVPLQSFVSSATGINGALVSLCEQAQVSGSEAWLREASLDYARRTAIMTGIEFGAFLEGLGATPGADVGGARGSAVPSSEGFSYSTDHLGGRTMHGFDFVGCQAQRRACEREQPEPRGPVAWKLVRLSNGASWVLEAGQVLVGRNPDCHISLRDVLGLSRRHAVISTSGNACSVRDLGSTNGVLVNGRRIAPSTEEQLRSGDRLTLGDEVFEMWAR